MPAIVAQPELIRRIPGLYSGFNNKCPPKKLASEDPDGHIRIGLHQYNISDLINKSLRVDAATTISFIDGILNINSTSNTNIILSGGFRAAKELKIKTKGNVQLTGNDSIQPSAAMQVTAKEILVNAPIVIAAENALQLKPKNLLLINRPILAHKFHVETKRVINNSMIKSPNFTSDCEYFSNRPNGKLILGSRENKENKFTSAINAKKVWLRGHAEGNSLYICAEKRISIRSNTIAINHVFFKSNSIYCAYNSAMTGITAIFRGNKLWVLGDQSFKAINIRMSWVINVFFGRLCGSDILSINSVGIISTFGARLCGLTVKANKAFFFNFLGIIRAYNLLLDNFISLDLGVTVPYLPTNFKELKAAIFNWPRFFSALRAIASYIYKPIYMAIKICMKIYSMFKNFNALKENLRAIYAAAQKKSLNDFDKNDLLIDLVNSFIIFKNFYFNQSVKTDLKYMFVDAKKAELAPPDGFHEWKDAFGKHFLPIFTRVAIAAAAPIRVEESVLAVRDGLTITGVEIDACEKLYERRTKFNAHAFINSTPKPKSVVIKP